MELADFLVPLGIAGDDPVAATLYAALADPQRPAAPRDWRMLSAVLARALMPPDGGGPPRPWPGWANRPPPLLLGIAGGQGAGKSTLARELVQALTWAGARSVGCSLDDFYLTRDERRRLAATVHPLLATRGVPGTHDVALLRRTVTALGGHGDVALPVFDKAADDRLPAHRWRRVTAPVDVLVLEGWCVGARAQTAGELAEPVNVLEAREDAGGAWRRHVNDALAGPYAALWADLDLLVYLQVPDMAAVARWRALQEQALAPAERMETGALQRFIAHYERLTRAMQRDLPGRADLLIRLDRRHRVRQVQRNAHDSGRA